MSNKNDRKDNRKSHEDKSEEYRSQAGDDQPEIIDTFDTDDSSAEMEAVADENSRLADELEATKAELEKEKKEYLFLMADFDNYRKRTVREKAEIIKNASEKVLQGLLPIVDDFERGIEAARQSDDAEATRQGMELIYNKLIKFLADNGVKAMESTGAPFDDELHEAIASIPAPSPELKGHVVDTTQKGYMINDKVLRHAKVAVGE